jgi:hypothetical protein
MPRLVHSVPQYRLHKGSGQAVVSLHGKDYYLDPWKFLASQVEYDRHTTPVTGRGGCHPRRCHSDGASGARGARAHRHQACTRPFF